MYCMSVASALKGLWTTSAPPLPTRDETLRATAEAHLAQEAKIQSLNDLIMVDDMEQIAFDDREKVRQYEAATVKGRAPTPEQGITRRTERKPTTGDLGMVEDMGHILGNVTIEQPANKNPISSLLTNVAVPLAAIGLAGWVTWQMMQPGEGTTPTTPTASDIETVPGFGKPENFKPPPSD